MPDLKTSILAVDPGKNCGWSTWDEQGRLVNSGILDGSDATGPASMIVNTDPAVIVREDWHVPRNVRKGHSGLKEYAYRSMMWQVLAEAFQRLHLVVVPAGWKAWANANIDGPTIPGGAKDPAIHAAIIDKAAAVARAHGKPEEYVAQIRRDECDAILIGAWGVEEVRRQLGMAVLGDLH